MQNDQRTIYLSITDYLEDKDFSQLGINGIPELSKEQQDAILNRAKMENVQVYSGAGVTDKEVQEMFAIKLKEVYQDIRKEEKELLAIKVEQLKKQRQALLREIGAKVFGDNYTEDNLEENYYLELKKYNKMEPSLLSSLSSKEVIEMNSLLSITKTTITKAEYELRDAKSNIDIIMDEIDEKKKRAFEEKEPSAPVLFTGKMENLNNCPVPFKYGTSVEPRKEGEFLPLTPENYFKENNIPYNLIVPKNDSKEEEEVIDAEVYAEKFVVMDEKIASLIQKIDGLVGKINTMLEKIKLFRDENDLQREKEQEVVEEALDGLEPTIVSTNDADFPSSGAVKKDIAESIGEGVKQIGHQTENTKKEKKKKSKRNRRGM